MLSRRRPISMKLFLPLTITAASWLAGCANIVHVPPGTSIEIALAKRPEVLATPEVPRPASRTSTTRRVRNEYVPPVEPALPTNDRIEAVAEAFTRGKDAFAAGKTDEAVAAFEQAVELDPKFAEAWMNLAVAYEKAGKAGKAKEAYRLSKSVSKE